MTRKPKTARMTSKEEEALVEQSAKRLREITTTEYHDLYNMLRSPRKLMWLNFLMGLARGIGLALGLTVLGAIAIAFLTLSLRKMVSVPVLGEYITEIAKLVKANMGNK